MGLLIILNGPAESSLRICNMTSSQIGIAIGYLDKETWISEGWWNLLPKACSLTIAGPLATRYYYIYGIDYDKGGEWTGDALMCTKDTSFRIIGVKDCLARGYKRNYFFEVDTRHQVDWSIQLTNKSQNSSEPSSDSLSINPTD